MTDFAGTTAEREFRQQLRDVNESLLLSSIHQHELTEHAERAEAAARDSQARFEALFDASPVGMYLVDSQLRISLVSRSARPVFGDVWEEGGKELIGSDFVEVIHILWPPQVADDVVARFRHTLATGQPYVSPEFYEERYDRHVREYYDWQIHRISLPAGRYGVVCYFLDISARVRSETDLRDSEARFRAIADGIPQLAWMADAECHVGWFNQGWLEYTGTTLEQNQGSGWKAVLHPDHLDRVAEKFERHLQEGQDWEDTFPLRGQDGEYRWFLSRMKAIRDESGKLLRFFGTNTDITEQRELERQVSQQAQSLADLHRRKDEFLAMLSHELRNPLAPIQNAVHLLRLQQDRSPIQVEAHAMIDRQVAQLARLVDDLLEVSRITTGRIHLQEERVDLRGIVTRGIESTEPQTGQKGQSVAKSLPAEPVWIYGDSLRLEQVVVNLLNNASKYNDRGGHIWVGLKQVGDVAVLRVRDTGVGITPEMLPRIFDLFTQADRSLDRSQGGLGIGLALVQSLVTMHRGRVEAQSSPGQGSEFIVTLPVMLSPGLPLVQFIEPMERPDHSLKVLVVDDSVDAAQGVAMLLRAFGHDSRMAHDGAGAMQAALEYLPQVVLLDIGLPTISGYDVAKWIRQQPALKDVVLIALTGYGQDSDRQLAEQAGFDHHFVKPADFAKVRSILSAVAEKSAAADDL